MTLVVMLLTLQDDNTIDSLHLFSLLYMFSMIMIPGYICTRMHLYTVAICKGGMIMNM